MIFWIMGGGLVAFYLIAYFRERYRIKSEQMLRDFRSGVDWFFAFLRDQKYMPTQKEVGNECCNYRFPEEFMHGAFWARDYKTKHPLADYSVTIMAMPRTVSGVRACFKETNDGF